MDLVFADESSQVRPTRPGMRPLIALGGLLVGEENVQSLNEAIEACCEQAGFPNGSEFKWSPGRELWMWKSLVGPKRRRFFLDVVDALAQAHAQVVVVVEDTVSRPANTGLSHEEDLVVLFLERVASRLRDRHSRGLIIADRPGGDRAAEDRFLNAYLELVARGTEFVQPREIIISVAFTASKLSRLLQAADLVTGCTLSLISGEQVFAPEIFAAIHPLVPRAWDRCGGIGIKIHPDLRYVNLYHWLYGDSHHIRQGSGLPLPLRSYGYFTGADVF
jgi:hypothetical protein